jgi:hypothetical protein
MSAAHPYSSGAWRAQSDSSSSSSSSLSSSSDDDDDGEEEERPLLVDDVDAARARWETLLARELSIANDKEHRAKQARNESRGRANDTVAYKAQRVHFDIQERDSVTRNWDIAQACLDKIRRYYLVLPSRHCLPSGFNGIKEPRIKEYLREWDNEISGKELAEAKASAARAPRKRAALRDMQD